MPPVTMIDPHGNPVDVPEDQIDRATAIGYKAETATARANRVIDTGKANQVGVAGATGTANAALGGVASSMTFGLSDVADRVTGGSESDRLVQEKHGIASTVGKVAGAILPGSLTGGIMSATGKAVARGGENTILGRAAVGAAEGMAGSLGDSISQLAQDPDLSAEHIASTISSNLALAGTVGGVVGGVSAAAEKGLQRAGRAIDEHIASTTKSAELPPEVARLDTKGLDALEKSHTTELENARAAERPKVAQDIKAFHDEVASNKLSATLKEIDTKSVDGMADVASSVKRTEAQLKSILENRPALEANPGRALDALQKQQTALEDLQKLEPQARSALGDKGAVLDTLEPTLKKNLWLQDQIKGLQGPLKSSTLDSIGKAREVIETNAEAASTGIGKAASKAQDLATVGAQGAIMHAVAGVIPIPVVGHAIGAAVAKKLTDVALGKIGIATGEGLKKTADVVKAFASGASKVATVAPTVASKAMLGLKYARDAKNQDEGPKRDLATAYQKRAAELLSHMEPGPDGKAQMRQGARQTMAQSLLPLRTQAPVLADKVETMLARRFEYLANELPKQPDLPTVPGAKPWAPSSLEMRTWAAKANAAENPGAVEAKLVNGTLTPEESDAYNACYPERAAQLKQAIALKLPELRNSLSYSKRLALSIFSGSPIDPAMAPNVLQALQATYKTPQGGPTQSVPAQPQFGSVKKSVPEPTPAQRRSG